MVRRGPGGGLCGIETTGSAGAPVCEARPATPPPVHPLMVERRV
jgi:hypothetical protein